MKKAFNLRLPVLAACAMVIGIAFAAFLAYFKLDGIFVLVPAVPLLAACALFAFIKRSASKALIFLFTVLCFLLGAVYAYAIYGSFCQSEIPVGELTLISGRVEEVGTTSSGNKYIILSHVKAYETAVGGRLYAYLNGAAGDYCQRGYTVTFYATVEKQNFIEYGEISYRATKGIKYWCNVNGGLQSKYGFSLFGEIYSAIERILYSSLDGETAAVCLAMLTGEDGGISKGTLSAFRFGGVAHVFAVSGLHVGVIYFSLGKVLKKFRLPKVVSAVIKIAFIAAYAGVCGFSPSSVRAVVLCSVAAFSDCLYKKYDGFNALAIAAVLLLLINPLYLFQVGFTLSFGAMLGITLLSGSIKKLFAFLPAKLSGAVSVGWSAQIGTLPVQITKFGYISAVGLFLNIVFVPLISLLYVLLFVSVIICAILPYAAQFILPVAVLPLQLVINLITACGFENAIIYGTASNWLFVPFFAAVLGLSDKFRLRLFIRGALIFVSALALLIGFIANSGKAGTYVTFFSGYSGGAAYVGTADGNVLIVTQDYNPRDYFDGGDIDALVVLGDEDNLSVMLRLGGDFRQVCMRGGAIQIPEFGSVSAVYADEFEVCGVQFEYNENGTALSVTAEGVTFTISHGGEVLTERFGLWCNDGYTVLSTQETEYNLNICGSVRLGFKGGQVAPYYAVPKE